MKKLVLVVLMVIMTAFGLKGVDTEQVIHKDIRVEKLTDGVWLHISYKVIEPYGRVPANGLLVVEGTDAVMIDTAWDDVQTGVLIDWIKKELGAHLKAVILTHYHADCMGGLDEAHKRGADSYATEKTAALAKQNGLPVPKYTFDKFKVIKIGSLQLELFHPGGGHTIDTCTVWLPKLKLLFAGDLARDVRATNLGNIKEADLGSWPDSLKQLLLRYKDAKIVIPGHGDYGGIDLLSHTAELLLKK